MKEPQWPIYSRPVPMSLHFLFGIGKAGFLFGMTYTDNSWVVVSDMLAQKKRFGLLKKGRLNPR